jgi:hypothetical protein
LKSEGVDDVNNLENLIALIIATLSRGVGANIHIEGTFYDPLQDELTNYIYKCIVARQIVNTISR